MQDLSIKRYIEKNNDNTVAL